jgi:hypothetical protein
MTAKTLGRRPDEGSQWLTPKGLLCSSAVTFIDNASGSKSVMIIIERKREWLGGQKIMSRKTGRYRGIGEGAGRKLPASGQAREKGNEEAVESTVHCLRKVSHDVRHVMSFRALSPQCDSKVGEDHRQRSSWFGRKRWQSNDCQDSWSKAR